MSDLDATGRALRTLLHEEMEDVQPDVDLAFERLETDLAGIRRRRRRGLVAAALVVLVSLAGFAVWVGRTHDPSLRVPSSGEHTTGVASYSFDIVDLDSGTREALVFDTPVPAFVDLSVSADGDRLALALPCDHPACPDNAGIVVTDMDGTEQTRLKVPDGLHVWWTVWSPDGSRLLYQASPGPGLFGNLYVHDIATDVATLVADLPDARTSWPRVTADFTPDGRSVVYDAMRLGDVPLEWDLWTVPSTGGTPTLLRNDAAMPALLADGSYVYLRPDPVPDLTRWVWLSSADGRARVLTDLPHGLRRIGASPDRRLVLFSTNGGVVALDARTGERTDVVAQDAVWLRGRTIAIFR
jgi:hypothetical protein